MNEITINRMLEILNIHRKYLIHRYGGEQAKTTKLYLTEFSKGEEQKEQIYYNGFMTMAEALLNINDLLLRFNPITEQHYYIERIN